MKKQTTLTIACAFYFFNADAQNNCSNPLQVNICPSVYLTNQTNAGMGDDITGASCNITGEDVLYEVNITNGADRLFVSVRNATGPFKIFAENTCGACASLGSIYTTTGSCNLNVSPANSSTVFVWVDAPTTITYEIAFGSDTNYTVINVPNTQGNLSLDGNTCGIPAFDSTKTYFQLSVNGVYQTKPLFFWPLNVLDTLCVTTFFKNTTGVEGIKKFVFNFPPSGYLNPLTAGSVPGFYNSGNWIATPSNGGYTWTLQFNDAAATGKGDFTGTPNTCLRYEFCFTVTPLSNNPLLTNTQVQISSDGFGAGYNGYIHQGCCPSVWPTCATNYSGGNAIGGTHGFGFGFNDPGTLPVDLTSFELSALNHKVLIHWTTAAETNNSHFTIQKSANANDWMELTQIKSAGNGNLIHTYEYTDNFPISGTSYYRLVQTDFNGNSETFRAEKIYMKTYRYSIYPNPVSDNLTVLFDEEQEPKIAMYNLTGSIMKVPVTIENDIARIVTTNLSPGIYYLSIAFNDCINKEKIIVTR